MDAIAALGLKPTASFEDEGRLEFDPNKIAFNIIGQEGHIRLTWDRRFPQQMKEAQEKFYELVKQGYRFFTVNQKGEQEKKQILRFDPNAEDLVGVVEVGCFRLIGGG